jgi:hypothetical protein
MCSIIGWALAVLLMVPRQPLTVPEVVLLTTNRPAAQTWSGGWAEELEEQLR